MKKLLNPEDMRRITYFLCKNEGVWYYPGELREAMALDIGDAQLRQELELLYTYDVIEMDGGRYGGVFDRTLKKVLMRNYGEILNLPVDEFNAYFKNDNMLDYLRERVEQLELSLAEARELREKLNSLRGEHNRLKGHDYERKMLLAMIRGIVDGKKGLIDGIHVTEFTSTLNYHLTTGEEIDILLEGEQVVIMAECKNHVPENLDKITEKMVDDFVGKATRLHQDRFAHKELRLGFFSKNGFEDRLKPHLRKHDIRFAVHD